MVFIVINTTLAIAVAIILSELEGKRKKVYQSAILLPNLLSTVIIGYLVFAFFSVENGFINNTILKALGKDPVSWYSEPKYWPFILVHRHLIKESEVRVENSSDCHHGQHDNGRTQKRQGDIFDLLPSRRTIDFG